MIDAMTKKPIEIRANGEEGGYLTAPAEQLDAIVKLLLDNGLRCWRTNGLLSVDNQPYRGSVVISRNVKPAVAQQVLDSVP
jgi:hypothetical protein